MSEHDPLVCFRYLPLRAYDWPTRCVRVCDTFRPYDAQGQNAPVRRYEKLRLESKGKAGGAGTERGRRTEHRRSALPAVIRRCVMSNHWLAPSSGICGGGMSKGHAMYI